MREFYQSFSRGVRLSKGFTLIELLIVIAIIAILATMAIPRIQEYRRAAAIAKLTNNARICLAAISQNEALSVISGATTLSIPSGCTATGTTQCECTDSGLGVTVTCTINTDGTVSCSTS